MDLREASFDTGEVVLNYAEGPDNGPSYVVLHGGSGRWQYGSRFLELLAPEWHVFAPDFRGHGKSARAASGYRVADYVRDTKNFLRNIIAEPAVVYGHSLGGEVAIKTAAEQPQLFRALIIGDAPLSTHNLATEEPTHRAQNELWRQLAGRAVDEIIPALKDMSVRTTAAAPPQPARIVFGEDNPWFAHQALSLHQLDPAMLDDVLEGPVHMLGDYDPHRVLPAISCPVLVLQADAACGAALTDDEVCMALELLPNVQHVQLRGIGHPLHGPHPRSTGGRHRISAGGERDTELTPSTQRAMPCSSLHALRAIHGPRMQEHESTLCRLSKGAARDVCCGATTSQHIRVARCVALHRTGEMRRMRNGKNGEKSLS